MRSTTIIGHSTRKAKKFLSTQCFREKEHKSHQAVRSKPKNMKEVHLNKLNWTQTLPEVGLNRDIYTYKSVESGDGHCGIHHCVILFYTH